MMHLKNLNSLASSAVTLTPSQQKVKAALYQTIKTGNERVLVVAPCAWGKTFFAASVIADAVKKGRTCLFVVHAEVLINQTLSALTKFGLNTGIIAGNYKENRTADVQVATVQALASRSKRDLDSWFNPNLVIVDEAHDSTLWSLWTQKRFPKLFNGKIFTDNNFLLPYLKTIGLSRVDSTWQEIEQAYKLTQAQLDNNDDLKKLVNSAWEELKKHRARFFDVQNKSINSLRPYSAILIGLTGSPFRLKKSESMADFFQAQVLAPTPKEMVAQKYLTPCVYYGLPQIIKTEGVKTNSLGDFNTQQLTTSALAVVKDLVNNYKKICPDRTFICFACSLRHAEVICSEFNNSGFAVKIVTANTDPKHERPVIYNELRTKQIQGVVSVDCLTTGFDVTNISCILLARPTKSRALFIQMIGRGMRLHKDKEDCLVLDQSGNVYKFGFIEELVYPELGENFDSGESPPIKTCPKCNKLIPIFISTCTCGHTFKVFKGTKQKKEATGELTLLVPEHQKPIYHFYRAKIAELYFQGKNPGYAVYLTQEKFRDKNLTIPLWIPKEWAKGAIFGTKPSKNARSQYLSFLRNYARGHNKDHKWVDTMFFLEFGK